MIIIDKFEIEDILMCVIEFDFNKIVNRKMQVSNNYFLEFKNVYLLVLNIVYMLQIYKYQQCVLLLMYGVFNSLLCNVYVVSGIIIISGILIIN